MLKMLLDLMTKVLLNLPRPPNPYDAYKLSDEIVRLPFNASSAGTYEYAKFCSERGIPFVLNERTWAIMEIDRQGDTIIIRGVEWYEGVLDKTSSKGY